MAKSSKPQLDAPPFPPLTWDGYYWEAQIVLPCWRGFTTSGAPAGRDEGAGTCWLFVHVEDEADSPDDRRGSPRTALGRSAFFPVEPGDGQRSLPTPEQIAAYVHLLDQQKVILDSVLRAVAGRFPAVERIGQLRGLVSLINVHVLAQGRDGLALVGFEFGCDWAEEYGMGLAAHSDGVGVLTHAGQVVAVGDAEVSFEPPEDDA